MTRARLIGIGVVCGLKIKFLPESDTEADSDMVIISKGLGVTSRGYLLALDECRLTKKRPYSVDEYGGYAPFQHPESGEQDVELLELLSDDYSGDMDEVEPLVKADLKDKVLLLFLEKFDKNLKSCLSKGCDEIGVDRKLNIRKLLISKSDLNTVKGRTGGGMSEVTLPDSGELPQLKIGRVLHKSGTEAPISYSELSKEYARVIQEAWDDLPDLLDKTYELYRPVLDEIYDENPFTSEAPAKIREMVDEFLGQAGESSDPAAGVQYLYGFMKDLLMAYEEFRVAGYEIDGICSPDLSRYPRHLMLGEPLAGEKSFCETDPYRHPFTPSPILTGKKEAKQRLLMLHKRLVLLFEMVDFERIMAKDEAEIKVTPSREKMGRLSGRTIPFYYRSKEQSTIPGVGNLEENWSYDLQKQCLPGDDPKQLSYDNHSTEEENGPVHSPLLYDLDSYNFLRIEGHVGRSRHDAEGAIKRFRRRYNLSFDLKTVYLRNSRPNREVPDCLIEDLQPQYAIWRNRMLLFVKNLVKAGETAERMAEREDIQFESPASFFTASAFRTAEPRSAGGFNVEFADLGNIFRGADSKDFAGSSERILSAMRNFERATRTEEREEEAGRETSGDDQMRKQLHRLNDCLHGLIDTLPPSIRDFSLERWLNEYKCVLRQMVSLMKSLAMRAGTQQQQAMAYIFLLILSAIQSFLLILSIYPYIPIRVLKETLRLRTREWLELRRFGNVLQNMHGMEHKAGVAPSDTFFLVCEPVEEAESMPNIPQEERERELGFDFGSFEFTDSFLRRPQQPEGDNYRVVADYTVPYICCDDCPKPVVDEEKIKPFAPPVTAVLMTELRSDQPTHREISYRDAEIQLLNNLYDPDKFEPDVTGEPEFGSVSFKDEVYEPDHTKTKKILVYSADKEKIEEEASNTESLFLIDQFSYRLMDSRTNEEIDSDTVTVFIPLSPRREERLGNLRGRIISDQIEEPLAGVNVIIEGTDRGTATNANGDYRFVNVPVGTRQVRASLIGFITQAQTIELQEGDNELNFVLVHDIVIEARFDRIIDHMGYESESAEAIELIRHHNELFAGAARRIAELAEDEPESSPVRKTADSVREFVQTEDLSVVRLNSEYEKRRDELVAELRRTEGDEREKYEESLEVLTEVYLDRVALLQPDEFSVTTERVIENTAKISKEESGTKLGSAIEGFSSRSSGFVPANFSENLNRVMGRG